MRSLALLRPRVLRALLTNCGALTSGAIFGLCLLLGGVTTAHAAKWEPVASADLAAKESAWSPGAAAEVLLSSHELSQTANGSHVEQYFRVKIYTQTGVELVSKRAVDADENEIISGVAGRVVKPDGRIVELTKEHIFETVEAKVGSAKRTRTSLAFPDLEVGDVVEYRWKSSYYGELGGYRFLIQDSLPVRDYSFKLASMRDRGSIYYMHCPSAKLTEFGLTAELTAHNLPAFEEEENMPPAPEFQAWLAVVRAYGALSDEDVWTLRSSEWAAEFEAAVRAGGSIKRKVGELIQGAANDDEKLQRLYDFCQGSITNYGWVSTPEIRAEKEKSRKETVPSPSRVLERGGGWPDDINYLFATMARAAGYKVRLGRSASRSEIVGVRGANGHIFLNRQCIAVEVGGAWRYFKPAAYFVPFGMNQWWDESVAVLRCDDKVLFDTTPATPAASTQANRKGRFTLDAEGTLEGDAEESYTGHAAVVRKMEFWEDSVEDVAKKFRERLVKRLPNAEVTAIEWTNLRTREMPLTVKYHVRVPGYAEQAGSRLALALSFFEAGQPVIFAAAERKYPIMFPYAYGEHDDVQIALPEGYVLDKGSAPKPVADVANTISATYKLQYLPKTRTFTYQRDFALGSNGVTSFRVESYPVLKALFEKVHASDTHSLLIKPKATAPAAAPAPAEATTPAPVAPQS